MKITEDMKVIKEAKDLATVLRACKATGVKELKIGDIEIKFGVTETRQAEEPKGETYIVPSAEQLREAEELVNIQENVDSVDDQLAFMHIDDPSQFEQLLIEKELEGSE
jgi:malic enzyme